MARILLGKGTTNAQGIAAMTEDAEGQSIDGYTGVGAGELDIVAEVTLDGSTFVSRTYPVCDAYVIDKAVSGTADVDYNSTDVYNHSSRLQVARDSNGTTLTGTTDGAGGHYMYGIHGATHNKSSWANFREFSGGVALEVDIVSFDHQSSGIELDNGDNVFRFSDFSSLWQTGENHLKITYSGTGNKWYAYVNGATTPIEKTLPVAVPSTFTMGVFVHNVIGTTLKFKNLRIYPI